MEVRATDVSAVRRELDRKIKVRKEDESDTRPPAQFSFLFPVEDSRVQTRTH